MRDDPDDHSAAIVYVKSATGAKTLPVRIRGYEVHRSDVNHLGGVVESIMPTRSENVETGGERGVSKKEPRRLTWHY